MKIKRKARVCSTLLIFGTFGATEPQLMLSSSPETLSKAAHGLIN
jgi:hypothetical protein